MKKAQIPTIALSALTKDRSDITFIESVKDVELLPLHLPYRTAYYGFGIALDGRGIFDVNLESFIIEKGTVLSIPPEAIKQWKERSDDLKTITILFEKSFFAAQNLNPQLIDSFIFFQPNNSCIQTFSTGQTEAIHHLLTGIKDKLNSTHPFKYQLAAHLLLNTFYEYAAIYNEKLKSAIPHQSRARQLVTTFKHLVNLHFVKHRKVQFYAERMAITAKHLTEMIKAETGKPAGRWIDDMVVLEAKVLLQDSRLSIAEVSDMLHFPDQSTFGKFFKNLTGMSPLTFRNAL